MYVEIGLFKGAFRLDVEVSAPTDAKHRVKARHHAGRNVKYNISNDITMGNVVSTRVHDFPRGTLGLNPKVAENNYAHA